MFVGLVGLSYEPDAKMLSVVSLIPLLFGYNMLVARFRHHREHLVRAVGLFYAAWLVAIAMLIQVRPGIARPLHRWRCINAAAAQTERYGLAGTSPPGPHRWLGWASYVAIESYGTIIVSMLWSVVASISRRIGSGKGYPLLVVMCQVR